jgi:hypothetical protein
MPSLPRGKELLPILLGNNQKLHFWQELSSNLHFRQCYGFKCEKYAVYELYKSSL